MSHYSLGDIESMMKTRHLPARFTALLVSSLIVGQAALGWDYEGHRVVNQLALATLPNDFPSFVKSAKARERIAFLAGEPDRWRNRGDDLPLAHFNGPDHYFDLEDLETFGLKPEVLPIFRYEFTAQLALARMAHPEKLPAVDPTKNKDHTRELVGFAPWAIAEYCGKLKSGFSYLKAYQDYGGTAEEIANAEQNILYVMGVMGHYVGDCAQPLHVTKHHHGWVGGNPNSYTTNSSFHAWIDGGFLRKTGGVNAEPLIGKIRHGKIVGDPTRPEDLFRQIIAYLQETHEFVEPLYRLDKDGKLTPENTNSTQGRAFLEARLIAGGQMLGDLWFSAWQQATEDKYLIRQLNERKSAKAGKER